MAFYVYRQNNSGGSFDYNATRGISVNVIIEADNVDAANRRAEAIGLYFDGSGDCGCCGSRWHEADRSDGSVLPQVYSAVVNPGDLMPRDGTFSHKWMNGCEGFIHYADGRIEGFWQDEEPMTKAQTDGTYGYGVAFNQQHVTVFTVAETGYDVGGNIQAFDRHENGFGASKAKEFPPTDGKPVIKVDKRYQYGHAWFQTKAEAVEFAQDTVDYINEVHVQTAAVTPAKGRAKLKGLFGGDPVDITNLVDDYVYDQRTCSWEPRPQHVLVEDDLT